MLRSKPRRWLPLRHLPLPLPILAWLALVVPWALPAAAGAQTRAPMRKSVVGEGRFIAVEMVHDDIVHFEMGQGAPPPLGQPFLTTAMVADDAAAALGGPTQGTLGHPHSRTPGLRLEMDAAARCLVVHPGGADAAPIRLCLQPPGHLGSQLTVARGDTQDIYGLGEQFNAPGVTDFDYLGKWRGGGPMGNDMVAYSGGMVGDAQFPVMYALGPKRRTYALFLDEPRRVTWDFTADPFLISAPTQRLRGYVILGDGLPDIRRKFMALTGRPPVPPKPAFGMWLSKYGYRSWQAVRDELEALRAAHIPVDGVVLDLFWFGGVDSGGPATRMGTLSWDPNHFGSPKPAIEALRQDFGVRVMTIEEAYVGERLPEWAKLKADHHLATMCGTQDPAPVLHDSTIYNRERPKKDWFWGAGGMLDWTQPEARRAWHNSKRRPLVDAGVMGFWTDLSEPRMFNFDACYAGTGGTMPQPAKQQDVHNLYALLWQQGIHEGLSADRGENGVGTRPFILSRSGTCGVQRFGTAMWSGDIGSNMQSLAAHMSAQRHLVLSGIDYFGSDIGGFWRSGLDGNDMGALFSTWLANGALIDVPVRPHTMDTADTATTNPARIGDVEGNRRAIRTRYALTPYLYSLAHAAHDTGEPVFPPLVYHFQEDPNVRAIGHEKMIGPDVLVGTITRYDAPTRDMYLPAGTWWDMRTERYVRSRGEWLRDVPATEEGHVSLPMFARAGAILPLMVVDAQTRNTLGARDAGAGPDDDARAHALRMRVFAGSQPSARTLVEDDGLSTEYLRGQRRTTRLSQAPLPPSGPAGLRVDVAAAEGGYAGAPTQRGMLIELVAPHCITAVCVDGEPLAERQVGPEALQHGWIRHSTGAVHIRLPPRDVATPTRIEARYGAGH